MESRAGKTVAVVALSVTCVAYLAALITSSGQLPERVASHFNFEGQADSWTSRPVYLALMAVWGLGISWLLMSVAWMIRRLPASVINLPHRDYWLAPERRQQTSDDVQQRMLWFSCLTLAFCLGIHYLVVDANQQQPSRLSQLVWAWLGVYLVALGAWLAMLLRHYYKPPKIDRLP
jgi:uncharacterized membrane protein